MISKHSRRAFSLLELLIVILIISIVYFLGFNGVEKREIHPKALTPLNLKSTIIHLETFSGEATLICTDQCQNCYIRENVNTPFEAYENKIDLAHTKVYGIDRNNALIEIDEGRYQDHKICLKMDFYKNGSSTQLIVENDHGIFFLPAFFGSPQKVDSLEDAQELWLAGSQMIQHSGDFY